MEEAVGVALYVFELVSYPSVAAFGHDFLQGSEDEGQGGAELVGYVDEEAHLHLVDFFLVYFVAAFHFEFGGHAFPHPEETEDEDDNADEGGEEEEHGPPCFVPYGENDDLEAGGLVVPFAVAVGGFNEEGVAAVGEVGVGNGALVGEVVPFFIESFEGVGEGVVLAGDVVGDDELQGEGRLRGLEGDAGGVADVAGEESGFVVGAHGFVEQAESGDGYGGCMGVVHEQFGDESGDAVDAAEVHLSGGGAAVGVGVELVALYAVGLGEVAELFGFGVEAGEAFVGAHPEAAEGVFEYAVDDVVGESVGGGVVFEAVAFFVEAVDAFAGADPEVAVTSFVDAVDEGVGDGEGVGKEVGGLKLGAVLVVDIESFVAGYPQAVFGVAEHEGDLPCPEWGAVLFFIDGGECLGVGVEGVKGGEGGEPEVAVAHGYDGVDIVFVEEAVLGEQGFDVSGALVEYAESAGVGADVDFGLGFVDMDGFDVVGAECGVVSVAGYVVGVSFLFDVVEVESAVVGADPEVVVGVFNDAADDVVVEGVLVGYTLDVAEAVLQGVVVVEGAEVGAKPHAALLVHEDAADGVLG